MLIKIRYHWCLALLILGMVVAAFLLGSPMSTFSREINLAFKTISILDELAHASLFFMLALLFYGAFQMRRRVLIGIVLSLGAITEILQGMVGRSPSVTDFLADGVGLCVALMIVAILFAHNKMPNKFY
tara:strand:- start:5019 stop:5405 length:387 start_codon:yes stop_codon:yes gene_type:complete